MENIIAQLSVVYVSCPACTSTMELADVLEDPRDLASLWAIWSCPCGVELHNDAFLGTATRLPGWAMGRD